MSRGRWIAPLAALALCATGCGQEGVYLVVSLVTDFTPGSELARVEVGLDDVSTIQSRDVSANEPVLDGLRVAEFLDLPPAAERVVRFVQQGAVESLSGKTIPMAIDTICVHGDSAHAVAMASEVRGALTDAGIDVVPMAKTLA